METIDFLLNKYNIPHVDVLKVRCDMLRALLTVPASLD